MTAIQNMTARDTALVTTTAAGKGPKRMTVAAREFESVMLNQWLQQAESSFGAAPGSDDDDDQGGQQMKSFATQQLAGQLAAHGGVGLAKLVQEGLMASHEAASRKPTGATSATTGRAMP